MKRKSSNESGQKILYRFDSKSKLSVGGYIDKDSSNHSIQSPNNLKEKSKFDPSKHKFNSCNPNKRFPLLNQLNDKKKVSINDNKSSEVAN